MISMKTNDDDDDGEVIKDELVRTDVQVLSTRLYDLRERFMKVIHKMNNDSIGFEGHISSEEDQTTEEEEEEESGEEMSTDEEDTDSTKTSSDDENYTTKSKIRVKMKRVLLESVLRRKSRHHEYIKHIMQYPKIIKYLMNDNSNGMSIPLRHLKPFIKKHVNKNPNGQIYDRINHEIKDIRRSYLKNYQ